MGELCPDNPLSKTHKPERVFNSNSFKLEPD